MKNVVKAILLIFLFMPLVVFADQYTYNEAIDRVNNYINSYSSRAKYIQTGVSFEFSDGAIKPNDTFVNGGLINKNEYEIGGRYLSPGAEYWTMTSVPGSANQYTISNILRSDRNSSASLGVRVTEYVKPGVQITGNGTLSHPWEFVESYIVYIGSNDVTKGTVSEGEIHVAKGGNANFTLSPKLNQGYRFKTSTCGVSYNASTGASVIRNVRNDINCLVIFDNQIYNFDLTDTRAQTQANPSRIILEYRNTWYSDENLAHRVSQITIPVRKGYTFEGYKFNGQDVINRTGTILREIEPTSLTTLSYKMEAQWKAINVTCSAGQYLPKNEITCKACRTGKYCLGGTYTFSETADQGETSCPSGYTSATGATAQNRCYISVADGKYLSTANSTVQTACPAGTYKAAHTVYYGSVSSCTSCAAGTYSTGGAKQCTTCPSGYTSATGATAQNRCYINVSAGKYLGTAKSSTQTNCPAGKYNPAHTVYYGSTSACSTCSAGTYSTGGAASCTTCPSGYTSAAGATAENKCYISVSAGKYLGTAKGTTQTACPAGQYKAAHTVYYGSTSACTNCSAGTYSTGGASSCTTCPSGYTSAAGASAQTRCYINVSGGKYLGTAKGTTQTACPAGTYKAAHSVYYGSTSACSNCAAGTYSTGSATSCTSCPSGYTSAAKATAQTSCYINVSAGKYLGTAKGTTQTNCPAGTYRAAHSVYYGNTSSCSNCGAGTYSTGGAGSCTSCPSGYTSAAKATAQTSCYISVSGGKYKTSATGTGTANCPAGTYKAAHNSYYNSSDSCSNCGAGTYSTGGATSCTNCPSGYTSAAKATAQSSCYINVPGGKYKTSATGSGTANCSAGYYRAAHTSYYNVGDSCSPCPAGQSSSAGASSCTSCAAGTYNTTAGSTCATCPKGQYCTGGTAHTNCPQGTYGASTGLKSSGQCTTCPAGYYCTGGTNKTACPQGTYRSGTGGYNSSHCSSCGSCKSTSGTARTSSSQCIWKSNVSTYNQTAGGYNGRIGVASNGSCITNIAQYWGTYPGYSYLYLSGNYGFEDYLSGSSHGYCSSTPLATWGFERYILSAYNKMEFTDWACQYAPVYPHAGTRWDAQWVGSGTRNYSFPSWIYGENTVYFQIRNGGHASYMEVSGLKFNINGSYYTLQQMVNNGYVEPLVLYGAADVYSASVALNLYTGGSQGGGEWPDTFALFTLKSGYNLRGFQAYQTYDRSSNDGYYVRVIDPNWFKVVLK